MFYVCFKRMCILLLLVRMSYKYEIQLVGGIFCLQFPHVTERGVLKLPTITLGLPISPLSSVSFGFMYFESLWLGTNAFGIWNCHVFLANGPFYVVSFFVPGSCLCFEVCFVCIKPLQLSFEVFSWYTPFYPFTFNLSTR